MPTAAARELTIDQIVRRRMVGAEYQPVVRLDSGEVVAFEAFPRGPGGSHFDTPAALFEAAGQMGLTAQLDQVAHAAAYHDVLAARMHPSVSLFVKADPRELDLDVPPDLAEVVGLALSRIRVFLEVDDSALVAAPAQALAGIDKARECGWGIAWNRLGSTREAFALIPFARPDVVKVDLDAVRGRAQPHTASLLDAVRAYAESTGASIIATHIASEEDLHLAMAIGATLGQGPHYAQPGPIPAGTGAPRQPVPILRAPDVAPAEAATPYGILKEVRRPVASTAGLLDNLADHLTRHCGVDPDPPAVIVGLPRTQPLSEELQARLKRMAANASLLVVIGPDLPEDPIPGLRYVPVDSTDPLAREWSLTMVGPHFCAVLAARDNGPTQEPFRYSYALTHNHAVALTAARALLSRLADGQGLTLPPA